MGWTGKFLGAFLGGLPGSFVGDIIQEANKKSTQKGPFSSKVSDKYIKANTTRTNSVAASDDKNSNACPNCGLTYAYDGVTCKHCNK